MGNYRDAINSIRVGAALASPNLVPAKVVREQARIAATTSLNKHKRYFAYGRLVPQADIAPDDQIFTMNSDGAEVIEKWLGIVSGDPQLIWAGYFDNTTGALVRDTIGDAIVVKPDAPSPKKGPPLGLILGGLLGGGALLMIAKKKG